MTCAQFVAFVNRVKYKPGYTFSVSIAGDFVTVRMNIDGIHDATSLGKTVSVSFSRAIHLYDLEHQGTGFARHWLIRFIRDWEEHEMAEWLMIDGHLAMEAQGHGTV